jgi:preprotein translocase subunit SecE
MNTKVEPQTSRLDSLKLLGAIGILLVAVVAYHYFDDHSLPLRVLGVLAAAGLAVAVVYQTRVGRATWELAQDSRAEVRKVVWPTRTETVQTTLIVFVMVILVGIILWLLDIFLLWAVKLLTGQGG